MPELPPPAYSVIRDDEVVVGSNLDTPVGAVTAWYHDGVLMVEDDFTSLLELDKVSQLRLHNLLAYHLNLS